MADLRTMPEDALVARLTLRGMRRFSRASSALVLAIAAALWFVTFRDVISGGSRLLYTVASVGLMCLAAFGIQGVEHMTAGRYRRELLRRAGWRPFSERRDEARASGRPALLLEAHALPSLTEFQVVLSERAGAWQLTATTLALRFHSEDPRTGFRLVARAAPAPENVPDDLSGEQEGLVTDGMPFTLHVLRPPPQPSYEISGNLAAGCRDVRTATLVHGLLDLAQAAGVRPALWGSCDARGNIVLGAL